MTTVNSLFRYILSQLTHCSYIIIKTEKTFCTNVFLLKTKCLKVKKGQNQRHNSECVFYEGYFVLPIYLIF